MTLVDFSIVAFVLFNGARAVAYVPQLIRVYRDPHGAAAVSVSTWMLFSAANVATAWYALSMTDDRLTALLFSINAAGCLAIVGLTSLQRLRYRRRQTMTAIG